MESTKLLNFDASKSTNIALLWNRDDFFKAEEEIQLERYNEKDENQDEDDGNRMKGELIFNPTFSHQIFKDATIVGYDPLKLNIYFSAGSLYPYLYTNYTLKSRNITNVEKEYTKLFSKDDPPTSSKDEILLILDEKENLFKPPGVLVHQYTITDKSIGQEREFEIYFGKINEPSIQKYHQRCQIFILWFIDGSSYIGSDDDHWDLFFLFEKRSISGSSEKQYGLSGFCTLYNYYHHPSLNRCRISQFLILPPYQRQGHGKQLLNSIYNYYKSNDSYYGKVYDMTVEDPCDEFAQLRNRVDLENILDEGLFKSGMDLSSQDNKKVFEEIRKKLLITTIQAKTCLEIYLYSKFMNTPNSDPKYRNFRIQVKKKLYKQFIGDSEMGEIVEQQTTNASEKPDQKIIEQNKLNTIIELYKTVEEDYCQTIQSIGLKIQRT